MAKQKNNLSDNMLAVLFLLIIGVLYGGVLFLGNNIELVALFIIFIFVVVFFVWVINKHRIRKQKKFLNEILNALFGETIERIESQLREYDDSVLVKSRRNFEEYSDSKYFAGAGNFEKAKNLVEKRNKIHKVISDFLSDNKMKYHKYYSYAQNRLSEYMKLANGYRVKIAYTTPSGKRTDERIIHISSSRIDDLVYKKTMLKEEEERKRQEAEAEAERKMLEKVALAEQKEMEKRLKEEAKERERKAKEEAKERERKARAEERRALLELKHYENAYLALELENKKLSYNQRIHSIKRSIDKANETVVVKAHEREIEKLMQTLYETSSTKMRRIKSISDLEWLDIDDLINDTNERIQELLEVNRRICDYYDSEEFAKIKQTCDILTQSQIEFNEYIREKTESLAQIFGNKIVRSETEHNDIYNYNRKYKKILDPFRVEVSSSVLSAAENESIAYIVKYFFSDKSKYKEQIEKLQTLLNELETLKDAKQIINNYKKDYEQYIQNVPDYVLDNDSDGFYSRLGLTIIDEEELTVEYRFAYTSDGGMAHRSFGVPMNEENIADLIHFLDSKLSIEALAKEQRALMTAKLRMQIKERDHYTCCQCGNSVYDEPNLLLEIDHIIPISKGGLTVMDNLQTLCWKCNRSKGAKII